jgi:excisionase family DNA binding protein
MNKMLRIDEVCGVLGVSVMTFYRIRRDHGFPEPAVKIGKKIVRWTQQQVESWIQQQDSRHVLVCEVSEDSMSGQA